MDIRDLMKQAADWQLAHPKHKPWEWPNAVFYSGLISTYRVTGERKYLEAVLRAGQSNRWRPGPRYGHADDHAVAQVYLDLARIMNDAGMYAAFRDVVDRMMAEPPHWPKAHQRIDYWWSDALFMSPPALAKLARATGEEKYLDFMDRLWREAHELLYDEEERLFFRDLRYRVGPPFSAGNTRGKTKVFWSRGNGWVLAGTARLLDELPQNRPIRVFYERLFRNMATRITALQPEDGLWRSDLLASTSSGPGESSGTALFCYALARGIHRGLLARKEYLPHVRRAWQALANNVDDEGRLGWVQRIGSEPDRVSQRDWEVFGTGAFLLASGEVLGLTDSS